MEQSDLPRETKIQVFWGQTKLNLNILIKKVEALKKELGRRNKGYTTHVPDQHTQLNCKSRLPTAKKTVIETYNLNNIVVGHFHEIQVPFVSSTVNDLTDTHFQINAPFMLLNLF